MRVNKFIDIVSIERSDLELHSGPIYRRLATELEHKILNGSVPDGQKLPTHRVFADHLGLAVGTISRAYAELEKVGLVEPRIGDGTFVCNKAKTRLTDIEFKNAWSKTNTLIDLSRNKRIFSIENTAYQEVAMSLISDTHAFSELLEYTPEEGLIRHRLAGIKWLELSQARCSIEEIICTNGAQHGLLCCFLACLKPNDVVVTEQLSYPGLITLARIYGVKLIGLELDMLGIVPSFLHEVLINNRVTALFCTPTLQNPTTATMPLQRRQELVALCRQNNLIIIEDDSHGVLVDNRPTSIQSLAPERTVLLTSISKALSPGLRAGWMVVPSKLRHRFLSAIRASTWMATPLSLELTTLLIENGSAMTLRTQQNKEVARRKKIVEPYLADLTIQTSDGCPHYWIEIQEPWRATSIKDQLKKRNILVNSTENFAVGRNAMPQFIRASVSSTVNDIDLIQGFRTIQMLLSPIL